MTTQPTPTSFKHSEPVVIAICCLVIIAALVLGVGLATNLVLRHVVQTIPLWAGVILGFRRSQAAGWVALAPFLIWFVLMVLIWSYLLGLSNLVSGHFSQIEIVMTIIVGAAAIVGIGGFIRFKSSLAPTRAAGIFVLMLAIQLACLRVSFLPAIAHR